jgi:RimJ/RimL family protein N-acetyltransferase
MKVCMRAFHGPTDWGWVQSKLDIVRAEDTCGVVAIDSDENKTIGALILENLKEDSAIVHLVISDRAVHEAGVAEECCDMMFNVLKLRIVYSWVKEENMKSIRRAETIGMVEIARIPGGASKDGKPRILMELRPENCQFLPKQDKKVA